MENTIFIAGLGGRIFNCTLRALANQGKLEQLKAVSASGPKNLTEIAEKIEHDSTHGFFPLDVFAREVQEGESLGEGHIGFLVFVNEGSVLGDAPREYEHTVPVFGQPDPTKLPLGELGIDVAIDATGRFLTREKAQAFLQAGAKKVVMSAPAKDDTPLVIYGINDDTDTGYDIVSRASCTTTCAAPIVKALGTAFGMPRTIFLNTTHAVTNSQLSLDGNSASFANGFGCMDNIVVTSTGATKSLQRMFPEIGYTTGISCRVPVTDGSICSLVMEFNEPADGNKISRESVLKTLEDFAKSHPLNLRISHRKTMISTYVVGRAIGSIVAPGQIEVADNTVHVVAGYDNEYGYSYLLALSALTCPLPA
ncbi:MAG: hypothetical protein FWG00_05575 [Coriobacteriia bacterium]|jgi:glyceraldehyde 3-phosphate dehydrogenase|nr:hypothetical protein [Coriobacteriia bacterium]MDR2714871.1 hypothetical protein [Coriobacteriales bacterium]